MEKMNVSRWVRSDHKPPASPRNLSTVQHVSIVHNYETYNSSVRCKSKPSNSNHLIPIIIIIFIYEYTHHFHKNTHKQDISNMTWHQQSHDSIRVCRRQMDSNMIRLSAPFTLKHTVLNKSRNSYSLHSLPASRNSKRLISFKLGSIRNDAAFDEAAFEAERLSLDAKAREAMAEASKRETSSTSTSQNEDDPKAWKWVIRKRIWDLMEARNVAQNPRPVHHRIPNFVGASMAAQKVIHFFFHIF